MASTGQEPRGPSRSRSLLVSPGVSKDDSDAAIVLQRRIFLRIVAVSFPDCSDAYLKAFPLCPATKDWGGVRIVPRRTVVRIARRVALCLPLWLLLSSAAYANPVHLRCEYVENPLGIDVAKPRLSWQIDNRERNWKQSGYELLVATTPAKLRLGKADVWESGKQAGAQSVGLVYGGPKLESRRRYYWTVRVWDAGGKQSRWAAPAWWEMGLLDQADWKAQWITWKNPEAEADRSAMRWIWAPGVDALKAAPKSKAVFQLHFEVGAKPKNAALFVLGRGDFQASVNGHVVGAKQTWHEFDREDIAGHLVPGQNTIEVTVTVEKPSDFGPDAGGSPKGGLAALLKITGQDGTITRVGSDANWVARQDSAVTWQAAAVVGQLGDRGFGEVPPLPQPAALFRRDFAVKKEVRAARLYVTALGSYRLFVDGQRVGDDVLTPDFTDYRKRVLYQTYDVTRLIRRGGNTLGAMLGDGWFGSGLTWAGQPFLFLSPPTRLLAQLELEYKDGTRETVASDGQWKAAQSAILRSEIYAGEVYDARQEQPGRDKPGFDDAGWQAAAVGEAPTTPVVSQISAPVHIIDAITPKTVKRLANGDYVLDLGQNMVGWVKLKVNGPAGTAVRMRFAEILNPDGTIYTENLRDADATDLYILRGAGTETFTPHFTFHGFRYVELSGYPGVPGVDSVTGEAASSVGTSPSGRLTTSSELVNRMWSIGLWGQRGNYLSVPTDCPQRDERLGWMGDAGVFWRTGSYNFDVAAFSQKWVNDVTDAQTTDGAFTNVSPDVIRPYMSEGAPGWGDAGVIVPWTTWLQYGDAEVIERSWDAMQRWMNFIQSRNPDFLRKNGVGPNFSDWLAPDERTSKELVATAYWALIAHMMSQMGHAIGKEQEAQAYDALYNHIRAAFQKDVCSGGWKSRGGDADVVCAGAVRWPGAASAGTGHGE